MLQFPLNDGTKNEQMSKTSKKIERPLRIKKIAKWWQANTVKRISPWRNGKSVTWFQNSKQAYNQRGTFRRNVFHKEDVPKSKGTTRCDAYFSFPYRRNTSAIDLMIAVSVIFSPMMVRKWIQRGNLETVQRRATPSPVMQEATGRIVRPENLVPKPRTPSPRHRFFRISVLRWSAKSLMTFIVGIVYFFVAPLAFIVYLNVLSSFFCFFSTILFYYLLFIQFDLLFRKLLLNLFWSCPDSRVFYLLYSLPLSCIFYIFLLFKYPFFIFSFLHPILFYLMFYLGNGWICFNSALVFLYKYILYKYLPYILISFLQRRKLLVF